MKEEDKNIADFFKKRLAANQFEYQESDWQLMEAKLDAAGIGTQTGTTGSTMLSTGKIIVGAILITSLGFLAGWLIRDQKENDALVEKYASQKIATDLLANNSPVDNQERRTALSEDEEECEEVNLEAGMLSALEKTTEEKNNAIVNDTKTGAKQSPGPSSQTTNTTSGQIASDNSNQPDDLGSPVVKQSIKTNTNTGSVTAPRVNGDPTTNDHVRNEHTKVANEARSDEQYNGNKEGHIAYSNQDILERKRLTYLDEGLIVPAELAMIEVSQVPLFSKDTLAYEEPTSPDLSKENSRFSIGVALSPDFNSAGLGNQMSASLRPGLLVYYQISPKVVLSTGAHFDQKRYESSVDRYTAPSGFWGSRTNGVLPSLIDGSCRVIDIPLNVMVAFSDHARINFGGSAGVSSYILLDETYDFEFARDNPGADTRWTTQENSSYIAGLINFSLYISTAIGRNTEFLIEPYLKTPIKDIGWANVALFGTGAQFTLKYNFKSNQKRKK